MEFTLFFVTTSVLVAISFTLVYIQPLLKNLASARKSNFPTIVCPLVPDNPIWMILNGILLRAMATMLPGTIWASIRNSTHGWEFQDQIQRRKGRRVASHAGKAYMFVTPGKNQLWVFEPELAGMILARRREFLQSQITQKVIGVLGPNVMTVEGQDWQRNRRIVAQALSERIMPLVWSESMQQAEQMISFFMHDSNGATNRTVDGLRQIAINVLACAGYGESTSWTPEESSGTPPQGHEMAYVDVLTTLASGFILLAMMPLKFICAGFMPKAVQSIGIASKEFSVYTKEKLARERELSERSDHERPKTFLSALVNVSDTEKTQQADARSARQFLSEDEIQGNLWQFSLAGYDTTANTMGYAVASLAVHPKWQEWVMEEIDQVTENTSELHYEDAFPKLIRCLAVMYETLRLYTPIANIGRRVDEPQTLATSSGTYHIPGNTQVFVTAAQLHTDPEVWGDDALEFRPSRWLADPLDALQSDKAAFGAASGAKFLPWSGGARVCPGMKMAQVEFVSVFVALFRGYYVRPLQKGVETLEEASERIEAAAMDSQPRLTLQMNRPRDVELLWQKRS